MLNFAGFLEVIALELEEEEEEDDEDDEDDDDDDDDDDDENNKAGRGSQIECFKHWY